MAGLSAQRLRQDEQPRAPSLWAAGLQNPGLGSPVDIIPGREMEPCHGLSGTAASVFKEDSTLGIIPAR